MALAPLVHGGSRDVPEIRDGTQEVTPQLDLGGVDVTLPEIDFSAVWFDPGSADLNVSFAFLDLAHRTFPDQMVSFGIVFESSEYAFAHAQAYHNPDGWVFLFTRRGVDGVNEGDFIEGYVDEQQSVVTLSIPCVYLHADLQDVVASSILLAPKPGGYQGGGVVWFRDVAPNSRNGPDVALACA